MTAFCYVAYHMVSFEIDFIASLGFCGWVYCSFNIFRLEEAFVSGQYL